MEFIFMLTQNDRTVADCLEVFDAIRPVGLKHVGFKDVGAEFATLSELNRRIKDSGATSYLEVVNMSPERCRESARAARQIGVDRLMGGTEVDAVLETLAGSSIAYYPFPGHPAGHPTALGGTPEEIAAHCAAFMAKGCAGADLLAYRATDAEPLALVKAARDALGTGHLIVAGSVNSPERVHALAQAGADAFTVGTAVFDGSFSSHKGAIGSRLNDVLAACP
jgi:2,4-dienoyl-CoA reductase-like NADH-dependent reductase (Old Yellow Enzyme family)